MNHLPAVSNPDVLVGLDTRDDAGVFRVSEDSAMIQTVDFFTPIVDDPYDFGQIAAANALSDIYAMGGTPATALNILGVPITQLSTEVIAKIVLGGYEKAQEAGVAILGGHSIKDPELKFGMAVTGFVAPGEVVRNSTAQPGNLLVLTKPLGTGILTTALKKEQLPAETTRQVTAQMKELNRSASEVMKMCRAKACTDVTGYGLMGHLFEMVSASGVTAVIEAAQAPLISTAAELAAAGHIPGGLKDNRKFLEPHISVAPGVDSSVADILFDPQTSGGLLIALPEAEVERFLSEFRQRSGNQAAVIGRIEKRRSRAIEVV